ncbi:PREDICTED: uncharacterized protein K02A2.6-like [Priapulus caudatus]|uniref:Uncharacterized protein K02A2.6-like n=1 Tax=Priapulus caudatus TaxID=37621 RepID=A0ABM1F9T1_PRICU|nr:PREDICTED: uncharacterized protein K02A2.6-like [Priapulus caudatus]
MITVDYYSDFFEVDRLSDKTAKEVVSKLKAIVARHGIPDTFVSNNGPPYSSKEFRNFMQKYEIEHVTSSPGYPQSNGKAENAVKTAKWLMTKALHDESDPYVAVLDWRNTPTKNMDCSPVQRLFGRRTKTLLPTTNKLLKPRVVEGVKNSLLRRKEETKFYNHGSKEFGKLTGGEKHFVVTRNGLKHVSKVKLI